MQDREVREEKVTPVYEPGGKFYKWFDNFWYHNKWKVIIIKQANTAAYTGSSLRFRRRTTVQ